MMIRTQWTMVIVLFALIAPHAQAAGCLAIKSPIGAYGISLKGHLVDGRPYGAVGRVTLQKKRFSTNLTTSVGGVISQNPFEGTVSLKNCELTLEGSDSTQGFQLKGQIVARGDAIFVTEIQSAQPMVVDGVMMPVGLSKCTNHSLKGTYTFGSQGYESGPLAAVPAWIPTGIVGVGRFNGAGCTSFAQTEKQASRITRSAASLQYTVASDCSVTFTQQGVPSFYGVLVSGGDRLPYLQLSSGSVRTGEMSRSGSNAKAMGCP